MPLKESKVLPAKVLHDLLQNWSSIENGKTAFSGKHGNISMMCKCALQPVAIWEQIEVQYLEQKASRNCHHPSNGEIRHKVYVQE